MMRLISMFILIRGYFSSMNAILVVVLVIQLVMSGVTITVEVVRSLIVVGWINNVMRPILIIVLRLSFPSFLVSIGLLVMHCWLCSCDSFLFYRSDRFLNWSNFLLLLFGCCLLLRWLRFFLLLLWATFLSLEVVKILLPVIIGLLNIFVFLLILGHGRLVNLLFISMNKGLNIMSLMHITILVSIVMLTMFLDNMVYIMVTMIVRVQYVIIGLLNLSDFPLML